MEKAKKDKLIALVLVLLVVAAIYFCSFGIKDNHADEQYNFVENSVEESAKIEDGSEVDFDDLEPGSDETNKNWVKSLNFDQIFSVFESFEGTYLWAEPTGDVNGQARAKIHSISEEEFNNKIASDYNSSRDTSLGYVTSDYYSYFAVKAIEHMMDNSNGDCVYYRNKPKQNYKSGFSAFKDNPIASDDAGNNFTSTGIGDYLKANGLELKVTNVKACKILTSNNIMALYWQSIVYVTADVETIENSGRYSDVDWIPDIGSSKEVEFAVYLSPCEDLTTTQKDYYAEIIDIAAR